MTIESTTKGPRGSGTFIIKTYLILMVYPGKAAKEWHLISLLQNSGCSCSKHYCWKAALLLIRLLLVIFPYGASSFWRLRRLSIILFWARTMYPSSRWLSSTTVWSLRLRSCATSSNSLLRLSIVINNSSSL